VSAVATDEIYEKYLQKAITEINELGDEIAEAASGVGIPVVGSGHPLADVLLLKYGPQASEAQEGVAFFGRAGQAILKSLQRLNVDPLAVYGTNCLKYAGEPEEEAQRFLVRELHIVGPKLIVPMGEDTLRFLNELGFPLSRQLEWETGAFQHFTPTIEALVCPDIDASLDDQPAKSAFWDAFKKIDEWWAKLPPY
jgi:uracil-DNA glycosylase